MDNTNEIIQGLADLLAVDTFRVFAVSDLVQRFASVENKHRHDPVIRNVGGAIERIAAREPDCMISAEEIYNLYNSFAGLNPQSSFKVVFADLLPPTEEEFKRQISLERIPYSEESRDLTTAKQASIEVDEHDEALDQAVEALGIGEPTSFAVHNPQLVDAGSELVRTQLASIGYKGARTSLKHCAKAALLYLASFPTIKGMVHINVPIAVKDSQPEVPDVFADLAGNKLYAFNEDGVKLLLIDNSKEQSDLVAADAIRGNLTSDTTREITKANAIEVDEVEAYIKDTVPQKLSQLSPELANLDIILEDAVIRKASRYPEQTIKVGRELVTDEFKKLGFKCDTRFAGDNDKGMTFDSTLWTGKGKVEVSVPVEVVEGSVMFPSLFVADDGEVRKLEHPQVTEILNKEELVDVPRYSAAFIEMSYNDLRKIIHKAAIDHKHSIAREALNLIEDKFGTDAHNTAVADYQNWIEQATVNFSERCNCCAYYKPRGTVITAAGRVGRQSLTDYCNLLHTQCSNVVRQGGVCVRAHLDWNKQHDDAYKGAIVTNQIRLT